MFCHSHVSLPAGRQAGIQNDQQRYLYWIPACFPAKGGPAKFCSGRRDDKSKNMKKIIYPILLSAFLLLPTGVEAKKAPSVPGAPTAAEQAFAEQYYAAVDAGGKAFQEFSSKITGTPGAEGDLLNKMLNNMNNGKAPNGGELKGFRGDPTDPGPSDWSNWDIQTDADGNVTGFKEKDFEAKDTDKDGKISDAEREAWDQEKKKRDDEAGGPPGDNWVNPDWDKNGDGKPDPGFALDCYQCVQPPISALDEEDFCHGNNMGPCPGTCSADEKCEEYAETGVNQSVMCHSCEKKNNCEAHGHFSSANCDGQCKEGPCVAIDMDKDSGRVVPPDATRTKGSTEVCYACMKITSIEVEYVIVIIETPAGRVILGNDLLGSIMNPDMMGFSPQKIMALATPNNPAIANLQKIAALSGGGLKTFSPGDIAGTLSGMLAKKKGNNPDDCFKDFPQPPAKWQGAPPADPEPKKKKGKDAAAPAPVTFGEDVGSHLQLDGPIIACGNTRDGNPAVAVFDSHGGNGTLIDKAKAAADPQAILNGVQKAQGFYQRISAIIQNPVQALTQEGMNLVSRKITERREPEPSKEKPRAKKYTFDPNDPLYYDKKTADKKEWKPHVTFGGGSTIAEQMAGGAKEERNQDAYDQWYLRAIGFTPKADKNSAWNVFEVPEPNVTVAVIDSGVDIHHPDGPKYIWTNTKETPGNGIDDDQNGYIDDVYGWNFLDDTPNFPDPKGHGTAVAGIIAAQSNNGIGIAGINPGAVIMPLKAADSEGHTNSLAIYRAIHYAVDNGARIINISLGGRGVSQLEQTAVSYAKSKGVFISVASGNTGEYLPHVGPASSRGVIAVGMTNMDDTRSPVSSTGANNGLVAPGERIISLKAAESFRPKIDSIKHKEYFQQDGTSFAAPQVAATASLLLAKHPDWTAKELEAVILGTAKDMGDRGWDEMHGAGMLDASAALRADPKNFVTVMVTGVEVKRKEGKKGDLEYVDIYGTVRGPFKDYVVGVGKGKNAGGFKKVSPVFTETADNQWLVRLMPDDLRGSEDWVVQISVNGNDGKPKTARAYFNLTK